MSGIPCYIFDIDGTVADPTHRLHHIQSKPKDWDAFFKAQQHDAPHLHILKLVGDLMTMEPVIFCSGRPDLYRSMTINWLGAHLPPPYMRADNGPIKLFMRKDGDRRDDSIVKAELLDQILAEGWNPIMAFDDRDRVVAMWRSRGIPCAQVAPGDF